MARTIHRPLVSRRFLACAAFAATLATIATSSAQPQRRSMMGPPDRTQFTVTAPDGVPEIPFTLINNHLILPVSVNGSEPLDVVLDTGMPGPGLVIYGGEETTDLDLDFDPAMQARVGGAGGEGHHLTAQVALSESLSLPGLELDTTRVVQLPKLADFGTYHDGIIGYSLFDRFAVEIDYDAQLLRLHDPENYAVPENAHVLQLTLRGNMPFATLSVTLADGEPFPAEVVVDLGASHGISLNTDASESISLPAGAVETALGHGLSGPIVGHLGRVTSLGLNGSALENVLASFPTSEHQNPRGMDSLHGNLGSDVLRRFNVTFDYDNQRMIAVPNGSFSEPFRFDRSGIRLHHAGELKVRQVFANSPAAEAGVAIDDLLTHVNGQPVTPEEVFSVRETLRGDGEVRLTFQRGEETYERTLTLRRLL